MTGADAVAVGDFNGDGKQDIAAGVQMSGGGDELAVLLGTGTGAFSADTGSPYGDPSKIGSDGGLGITTPPCSRSVGRWPADRHLAD